LKCRQPEIINSGFRKLTKFIYLADVQVGADFVNVGVILEQCVDRDTRCTGNAVARISSFHYMSGSAVLASNSQA